VLEALRARGVDAFAVDGIPALRERSARRARRSRVQHPPRHHGGGEDGVLQGLLEAFGVPYTGSDVLGSALSMDKIRSKQVWLALGLPTPRYVRLRKGDDVQAAARSARPAGDRQAGLRGLQRRRQPRVQRGRPGRRDRTGRALSRRAADGTADRRAASSPSASSAAALPSIRIVPKGAWYDYHAKYVADDTQYLCPGLDGAAEPRCARWRWRAFEALGCRGWGRVDVMRDRDGRNWLLEVNTAPGMTSHSLVPKARGRSASVASRPVSRHPRQTLEGGRADERRRPPVLRLAARAGLVTLPVVAVVNGWFASERWPLSSCACPPSSSGSAPSRCRRRCCRIWHAASSRSTSTRRAPRSRRCPGWSRWRCASAGRTCWRSRWSSTARWRAGASRGCCPIAAVLFEVPDLETLQGLPRFEAPDAQIAEVMRCTRCAGPVG
jgi:D-alanine-D-alanine ligase